LLQRAWQWTLEQLAFLAVLVLLGAAFVYLIVEPGHWRRGSGVIAVATLLAAVLRAVLPQSRAGLLAVRARWIDVVAYAVMGGAILGLAIRLHS
jgi:hypothetical protein